MDSESAGPAGGRGRWRASESLSRVTVAQRVTARAAGRRTARSASWNLHDLNSESDSESAAESASRLLPLADLMFFRSPAMNHSKTMRIADICQPTLWLWQ